MIVYLAICVFGSLGVNISAYEKISAACLSVEGNELCKPYKAMMDKKTGRILWTKPIECKICE